jgi:hypothetical protein
MIQRWDDKCIVLLLLYCKSILIVLFAETAADKYREAVRGVILWIVFTTNDVFMGLMGSVCDGPLRRPLVSDIGDIKEAERNPVTYRPSTSDSGIGRVALLGSPLGLLDSWTLGLLAAV